MSIEKEFTLDQFRTQVIVHIVIITVILMAETYLALNGQSYITLTFLAVLLFYFIYKLFAIVNKTNRDLTNFLMSIRFDDYETTYSQKKDGSGDKTSLYNAFNLITGKFRDIRSEKEAQHQFLFALIEQVDTGLICFDDQGRTILMNDALQQLLHKSYLPSIESLKKVNEQLYETLVNYVPGARQLLKIQVQNDLLQLTIVGNFFKSNDQTLKLFSFHNINSELDVQEMRSWEKLIRILTHEIMNSVTPVVSLAATTDVILREATGIEESTREDIHQAIKAIQKRSELLLDFTRKYRELTRIPIPEVADFDIKELLERLIVLHTAEIDEKKISVVRQFPLHKVILKGDESMLEQAFMNLIKNGLQALDGRQEPRIEIGLRKTGTKIVVQIADNGDGIEETMLDQIFVPFFTTKKEGSGIGLSLGRQIILLHHGSINVSSQLGRGTVFTIKL
ncbi:MAG: two-component system nitrogen regulation sensor histidine kinase NtrY [Saprospiraceae bacterium]|jgi:two-component system nitrogen regulation sensor histidine kinase NtrY